MLAGIEGLGELKITPVEKPIFVSFQRGEKYGRIHTKTHITGDIFSVKHAETYLKTMLDEKIITVEEKEDVSRQIEMFFAPGTGVK